MLRDKSYVMVYNSGLNIDINEYTSDRCSSDCLKLLSSDDDVITF